LQPSIDAPREEISHECDDGDVDPGRGKTARQDVEDIRIKD
jgi:hypothetical protein